MAIFLQGLTNIDKRCDNAGERAVLHQLKGWASTWCRRRA